MRKSLLIISGMLFIAADGVGAQWVPVSARIRETTEVFVDGRGVESRIREGRFYRQADGSTLEEWDTSDGSSKKSNGTLTDARKRLSYQLDVANRHAIERAMPGNIDLTNPPGTIRTSSGREATVGGVRCLLAPVRLKGQMVPMGENCYSNEYRLLVKTDMTTASPDGKSERRVYEMYEIDANSAPDPSLFDLRARGFTVYRATDGK